MISARALRIAHSAILPTAIIGPYVPVSPRGRIASLGVALVCAAILALAAWLPPDARGHGTHERLGLPPCSFILISGLPCPTCGMTTAFAYMMHGRPWTALRTQSAGAVLCLATVGMLAYALRVAATARMHWINWDLIGPVRLTLILGLGLIGAWAFKMAIGMATGQLPVR